MRRWFFILVPTRLPSRLPEFQARFDRFDSARQDILFYGDSIFAGNEWTDVFPGKKILNFSVPGGTSIICRDILEKYPVSASVAVQLIGLNDVYVKRPIDTILENHAAITELLSDRCGRVFVLAILPTMVEQLNIEIDSLNANLKKRYDQSSGIQFIDVAETFAVDGTIDDELFLDDAHLSPKGYARLSDSIKKALAFD